MAAGTWDLAQCSHGDVEQLATALGIDEVTASVLVRRGLGAEDDARRFLDGALPGHDPFLLGDMRAAVETIVAAIEAGARICVHGDYDADGICATALAVLLLRELEADVAWHLPSRFEEGYGLNGQTLTRLAEEASISCSPSTAGSPRSPRWSTPRRSASRSSSPTITALPRRSRPARSSRR